MFVYVLKSQGKSETSQRHQCYSESDYIDPKQGLCLGALFDIAATNVCALCAISRAVSDTLYNAHKNTPL